MLGYADEEEEWKQPVGSEVERSELRIRRIKKCAQQFATTKLTLISPSLFVQPAPHAPEMEPLLLKTGAKFEGEGMSGSVPAEKRVSFEFAVHNFLQDDELIPNSPLRSSSYSLRSSRGCGCGRRRR